MMENLLRPPVELISAAVSGAAGILALTAPKFFLMPSSVASAACAGFLLLAAVRARQGYRVLMYQRNIRRLSTYQLRPEQVPVSRLKLFLGRGFRWSQVHTQRLLMTRDPAAARYRDQGRLYYWVRSLELRFEHHHWMTRLTRMDVAWNPVRPLPPVGGDPAIHGVELDEQDVVMDIGERVGHTLVLGTTRVGKTRLCELLVTQDIRRGDVVVVFDPKGDAELLKRMYAEACRAGRQDEFYVFHLGYPALSSRYNPIGNFFRITEVASRIAGQLPSEGNSAAFREFAWRFTNSIARALIDLGKRPDLTIIQRYVTNIEALFVEYTEHWLRKHGPDDWKIMVQKIEGGVGKSRDLLQTYKGRSHHAIALAEYLLSMNHYDPVVDSLRGAFTYDRTYFDKITASLLPLLEKLTTGRVAELLAPDYSDISDSRPIFDWMQVIRRRGIVYVGLDALSDYEVAGAVGNSMFADLTSVAGQLYKFGAELGLPGVSNNSAIKFSVHADEFNELIGDEFIPLLNKAGGAGYQVTAYTQTWSDIEARIGNKAKSGQIGGNFNNLIMLRVKNIETASVLTDQLPRVRVHTAMTASGVTDTNDMGSPSEFISRTEDRLTETETEMLSPADMVQLPKGQAFALIDGGQLWKIRIPLAANVTDIHMPPDISTIVSDMAARYGAADLSDVARRMRDE